MSDIIIVTAFFDIGRGSWGSFKRSNDEYFNKFAQWSVLQNPLIVYVETEADKERVLSIRSKQGRLDRTKVVVTSPFRTIDGELTKGFEQVSHYKNQRMFRRLPDNPESWNPDYNLIMLLKFWCVDDAVRRYSLEGQVAWVDFGFRPTGYQIQPKATWDYSFGEGITLFAMADYDGSIPLFQIIQSMDTFIMGTVVVGEASAWPLLWEKLRDYAFGLLRLGIMDDDQVFLLMALNNNSWCKSLPCPWGKTLLLYGGESMEAIVSDGREDNSPRFLTEAKRKIKVRITSIRCGIRVASYLSKETNGD